MRQALSQKLHLAVLDGVDPSPSNVCAAGLLALKVNDHLTHVERFVVILPKSSSQVAHNRAPHVFQQRVLCFQGGAPAPSDNGHGCLVRLEVNPNFARSPDGTPIGAARLTVRASHPAMSESLVRSVTALFGGL